MWNCVNVDTYTCKYIPFWAQTHTYQMHTHTHYMYIYNELHAISISISNIIYIIAT